MPQLYLANEALSTEQQNELYGIHQALIEPVVNSVLARCPEVLRRTERADMMQDGRHGLLRATRTFDPVKGLEFTKWANLCIYNEIRAGLKTFGLDAELEALDDAQSTPEHLAPDATAEARVLCDDVLSKLSPNHRAALRRHFLLGESKADMARALNVSRAAVGQLIARALGKARAVAGVSPL